MLRSRRRHEKWLAALQNRAKVLIANGGLKTAVARG